jgi:hypothetical protein
MLRAGGHDLDVGDGSLGLILGTDLNAFFRFIYLQAAVEI